jgi:hypothetical protein
MTDAAHNQHSETRRLNDRDRIVTTPEPNTGDRNSHGSRVHEFPIRKIAARSPEVYPQAGGAKIVNGFPTGSN